MPRLSQVFGEWGRVVNVHVASLAYRPAKTISKSAVGLVVDVSPLEDTTVNQLLQNEVMTGKSKFGSACAFVEMVSISDSRCLVLSALLSEHQLLLLLLGALNYSAF